MASMAASEDNSVAAEVPPVSDSTRELKCTPEERRAIDLLRQSAHDWIAEPGSDAGSTEAEDYLDDNTLFRYAIARDFDTAAALSMFKESLRWKRDFELNKLLCEWRGKNNDAPYSSFCGPHSQNRSFMNGSTKRARFAKAFFYSGVVNGVRLAKGGGPLMIEKMGEIDLSGIYYHEEGNDLCLKSYAVCKYCLN